MFTTDYRVVGKHATYIKFLNEYTKNLDKEAKIAGIFATAVDVYMVAPLIGVAYGRKAPIDTESKDDIRIFAEAIVSRQKQLEDIYRLVILYDKSNDLSDDERIDRAFKTDEKGELLDKNLDIFHQYLRGGVEWLFENINENATTTEDYLDKIKDIVFLYAEDFELPLPIGNS